MYSNKIYLLYQFRKEKKEKFVDLEEKLRTSDASLRTSDASAADLEVQLGKLDSKLKKIDEKSKEKKHLKKEILRVLKMNSLRKSTRNKVKELNIGFFPRNKVEILTGVISLDLVQEQEVISKKNIEFHRVHLFPNLFQRYFQETNVKRDTVTLQHEGAHRFMGTKTVCAPHEENLNTRQLGPLQLTVVQILSNMGLCVDTAHVFSTEADEMAFRQGRYIFQHHKHQLLI